jgi:tripartite-type tricarboxylate transporter receptor subunit TctC
VGDACWAVGVTVGDRQQNNIASLRTAKELTVGTVGQGNVSHLTAIAIAERYKIDQRVVLFKSNYDAVINLIGNNGVTFVVERVSVLQGFQSKTPDLRMVGMSCTERHPDAPELQTLAEQGFNLPSVFNIVMAHKNMPDSQRQEIGKILDQATLTVGKDEIRRMSDFISPVFAGKLSAQQFYNNRITAIKNLRTRYRSQISSDK